MKLSIPDMSCGHCKATVERAIAEIDPAAKVAIDLQGRTADVTSGATTEAILAALKAEGYPSTLAG